MIKYPLVYKNNIIRKPDGKKLWIARLCDQKNAH